jgi:hypothetical protein
MLEAIQGRSVIRAHADAITGRNIRDKVSIKDGLDRIAYWWAPERREDLEMLLGLTGTQDISAFRNEPITHDDILRKVWKKGFEVWLADITLPAVSEAGFEVVRLAVPALHKLRSAEQAMPSYSTHRGRLDHHANMPPHPIA